MLSTYARLMIGPFAAVTREIGRSARPTASKAPNVLGLTILTPDQVNQTFADPHKVSLKRTISNPVANHLKAVRALIKSQESIDDQRLFIQEALNTLQGKIRQASPDLKSEIGKVIDTLNNRYKLLGNYQNAVELQNRQLAGIDNEMNDLTTRSEERWVTYRDRQLHQLRESVDKILTEAGLQTLPQGEVDNLLRQDTWQEVLDRFNDVGAAKDLPPAEIEKLFGLNKPDAATLFKLKAYMAIRSVNPARDGKLLSRLNSNFDQAIKEANEITSENEANIRKVDSDVQPILSLAESNQRTLAQLNDEQDNLVNSVLSRSDLENIIERAQTLKSEVRPQTPQP